MCSAQADVRFVPKADIVSQPVLARMVPELLTGRFNGQLRHRLQPNP
jgi:hypothetical protein